MNADDLEILKHMMNGATPPDFAVRLLEDVCERTGLSWKARHVYLQKRRNKNGADSWQAVLSIDGFRAVGARHPDYAGQEGPFFVTSADGAWTDIPPEGKPYASKVGIRKKSGLTTWGVAKFADYYAGMMWDKFPSTMVSKCAEMLAWRKTFPETFGGLYGDTEMEQDPKTVTEDPMKLKEKLHEYEKIAEVLVPVAPSNFELYAKRIEETTDPVKLTALGKEIQKDKTLGADAFKLHDMYTKKKAKLG